MNEFQTPEAINVSISELEYTIFDRAIRNSYGEELDRIARRDYIFALYAVCGGLAAVAAQRVDAITGQVDITETIRRRDPEEMAVLSALNEKMNKKAERLVRYFESEEERTVVVSVAKNGQETDTEIVAVISNRPGPIALDK